MELLQAMPAIKQLTQGFVKLTAKKNGYLGKEISISLQCTGQEFAVLLLLCQPKNKFIHRYSAVQIFWLHLPHYSIHQRFQFTSFPLLAL
jgi:hypothetical protein